MTVCRCALSMAAAGSRTDWLTLPAVRDSLFLDVLRDGSSMLKVWNVNSYGGVVGAFNLQVGTGHWALGTGSVERRSAELQLEPC